MWMQIYNSEIKSIMKLCSVQMIMKPGSNLMDGTIKVTVDMNVWPNPEDVAKQIKDNALKKHKHRFVTALDGTRDKICVICGIRAKQAVLNHK